jgi:hypothetical protein
MYVCVLDNDGKKVYHKNIPCRLDQFLKAIKPFRGDIVVGVEWNSNIFYGRRDNNLTILVV